MASIILLLNLSQLTLGFVPDSSSATNIVAKTVGSTSDPPASSPLTDRLSPCISGVKFQILHLGFGFGAAV
ncbi:hypothetical protein BKA62DRAFT_718464 [Auriculariales sp. MPI-PUGE-AT-0066]|nr:hypothetical protein BKA62DRAFT_718464 [Auriculariales sp. MPI-PUGE-AT-0066]